MQPWMGGGEMIQDVYLEYSTYAPPPLRFEAGTPAIGETVALGAAVDYLTSVGMDNIHDFEVEMGAYLYEQLSKVCLPVTLQVPVRLQFSPSRSRS